MIYYNQIAPEYQFGLSKNKITEFNHLISLEKPAIDRLLDFISNQESQKPAIDILIQEYVERIGSPLAHQSTHISPLMDIRMLKSSSHFYLRRCIYLFFSH